MTCWYSSVNSQISRSTTRTFIYCTALCLSTVLVSICYGTVPGTVYFDLIVTRVCDCAFAGVVGFGRCDEVHTYGESIPQDLYAGGRVRLFPQGDVVSNFVYLVHLSVAHARNMSLLIPKREGLQRTISYCCCSNSTGSTSVFLQIGKWIVLLTANC